MAFVCIVVCPGQDPQRFVVYWRDSTLILWLHVRKKLSTMWLEAGVTYLVRPYRFLCGNLTSKNLMSTSCIRQRETIHQEDVIGVAVPLGVFSLSLNEYLERLNQTFEGRRRTEIFLELHFMDFTDSSLWCLGSPGLLSTCMTVT